ncbi:penicillin-binding protein 1C [Aestuariicoccus sp. MJ-SS9]|uniref:penicillin-binding protein 1C n=1 Tax=Aestuariicoccus sp. MJ-SS9 TaxID=3079855 RepID=UPI0029133FB1|nr:penicillin-binding protein 1C [Aestuariicoccus sp. MJ-SS9]MDU8910747.1 penicillin-binding protein 1C [Aestuariicoccus sp. MJ-SS9]
MRPDRWLILGVALLWSVALARDGIDRWAAATELPVLVHATAPEVRDRNGTLLRAYTVDDGIWRLAVSVDRVDAGYIRMLTAFEDKRFYRHSGVDPLAMARAVGQAVWHGRVVSGGSTLTMQVARLLEDSGTGRWPGKLRQIRVALALERRLDKDAILSLYLHLAPFGGNIEGVRAASLAWFGKEPRRLTPGEAALLVALPQSPETRRPDRHPQAARAARARVLSRMAEAGVLPAGDATAALRDPIPSLRHAVPQLAPHMADRAVARGPGRHDLTLDADLQARLETLAQKHMTGRDPRLSLALMVADHTTGEILASVGSAGYENGAAQGFVDMTRALRSPGSTLKPLVYGLAFDRGLAHPETLILDAPVQFGGYAPQNFDGSYRGELRVAQALQLSLNIPVVRLTDRMGPAHLMTALRKSGADPKLPAGQPGLAMALGGVGMTLEDLVQLYAALAHDGMARPLIWDRAAGPGPEQRLLSPQAAWQVGHILAGIAPPPAAGPPGRVAYKTGTSYGHRDAWAIGYDGRYVAGVWIGRPDGTPVPGAFGADQAAPLLFQVLQHSRTVAEPLPATPPETLLVGNARLPLPLQRFDRREPGERLSLTFPPEGARLALSDAGVPLKLRGGTPPFTLMADGAVLATGLRRSELNAAITSPGFTALSVIDAAGQADSVRIELR